MGVVGLGEDGMGGWGEWRWLGGGGCNCDYHPGQHETCTEGWQLRMFVMEEAVTLLIFSECVCAWGGGGRGCGSIQVLGCGRGSIQQVQGTVKRTHIS